MPVSSDARSGGVFGVSIPAVRRNPYVSFDVIGVVQIFADDHVDQAEGERRGRCRETGVVLVGEPSRSASLPDR